MFSTGNKFYKKVCDLFIETFKDDRGYHDIDSQIRCNPIYAHEGDAGMDVFACNFVKFYSPYNEEVEINERIPEFVLHPGQRVMISTGIKADIPEKIGIFAVSRSGLSTKHGIILVNSPGTIDNIYKGYWCFTFGNISKVPYTFNLFDKIGQVIPFEQIKLNTKYKDKISSSSRGEGGFGHSGK